MSNEEYEQLLYEIDTMEWYWKSKARHKNEFTAYDIIRFITYNIDQSDLEYIIEWFRVNDDQIALYGEYNDPDRYIDPDSHELTTWQILAMTMHWLYKFVSLITGPIGWADTGMIWKLYDQGIDLWFTWNTHYNRMVHLNDPVWKYSELLTFDYLPIQDEIPWWSF